MVPGSESITAELVLLSRFRCPVNFGCILCEAARAWSPPGRFAAHGPPSRSNSKIETGETGEMGETGDTAEKRAGDVNGTSMIRYLQERSCRCPAGPVVAGLQNR